ncbi:MAG TPA: hypothetical protein VF596_09600 [Pyrinomonadaceae bacterium]|jgi:hypothetical protein
MNKSKQYIFAAQIILILAFNFFAQTQQPNKSIWLIRAGRLFDSENGFFLSARNILVKDNFIESVGENLLISEGAQVIEKNKIREEGR